MSTSANNNFDAIEHLIFTEGLRIEALDIHPDLDVMTIYLNTKVVLTQFISAYPLLKNADKAHVMTYELTGGGTGIHWPLVDEDLSLKGFLQDELRKMVNSKNPIAA